MKNLLRIYSLFLPLTILSCNQKKITKILVIEKIYDGDTVYLNNKNKGRILGIDAPEIKSKEQNFAFTKGIEYMAALRSRNKLFYIINNNNLKIIKIKKDKYKRDIIKIEINNEDVGILMIKYGMARVAYISNKKKSPFFYKDEEYYKKLLDAQYQAYINKIGIWSRRNLYKDIFPKKINQ